MNQIIKLLIELGPLIIFFYANNHDSNAYIHDLLKNISQENSSHALDFSRVYWGSRWAYDLF